jgi:hypothetical protein
MDAQRIIIDIVYILVVVIYIYRVVVYIESNCAMLECTFNWRLLPMLMINWCTKRDKNGPKAEGHGLKPFLFESRHLL